MGCNVLIGKSMPTLPKSHSLAQVTLGPLYVIILTWGLGRISGTVRFGGERILLQNVEDFSISNQAVFASHPSGAHVFFYFHPGRQGSISPHDV